MVHVLLRDSDKSAVMVCGRSLAYRPDQRLAGGQDYVGLGNGRLRDGTRYSAAQQLAMVDCQPCRETQPLFDRQSFSREAAVA